MATSQTPVEVCLKALWVARNPEWGLWDLLIQWSPVLACPEGSQVGFLGDVWVDFHGVWKLAAPRAWLFLLPHSHLSTGNVSSLQWLCSARLTLNKSQKQGGCQRWVVPPKIRVLVGREKKETDEV